MKKKGRKHRAGLVSAGNVEITMRCMRRRMESPESLEAIEKILRGLQSLETNYVKAKK